jgi:putative ABC transport system ATP-binding protein
MIEVDRVSKIHRQGQLNVAALREITCTIPAGAFTFILGPSGSGKSTLLYLLGGLDEPTSGDIRIQGRSLKGMSTRDRDQFRRHDVGFVFQNFNLLARTTAAENVELPLIYAKVPPAERHRRSKEALERVGLGHRASHHPSQLSGGQQQRVAIARALVSRPPLILADEPTGNLDSATSIEIMKLLTELQASGMTIVFVTHEADIAAYAARKLFLKDGAIISDLRQQPMLKEAS